MNARGISRRLSSHLPLKFGILAGLNLFFWTFYHLLGWRSSPGIRVIPRTWIDDVIPFAPQFWIWIYLSAFLLTTVIPWLLESKEDLRHYVEGVILLSATSFLIFFLFPVASPRPDQLPGEGLPAVIYSMDGPLNAFPSLHAGFLVYNLLLARRAIGGELPRALWTLLIGWAVLILYSTVATGQHYVLDLVAGALLAVGADRWAWRRRASHGSVAATSNLRSSAVQSQGGFK